MSEYSRQTGGGSNRRPNQELRQRNTAKRKAARRRRKMAIFVIELLILVAMVGVLYVVATKGGEGPKRVELGTEPEKLEIATEVQQQEETTMKGYWNIALFGVDANSEAELVKGGHSDSTMIASINLDTGDIKLVSVYRDTYLNTGDDVYYKSNHAYHSGGGEQAVKMLNSNLDMNINDFVAINYQGVIDIVDGLGGIYIDVDSEELKHINNYQYSINEAQGKDVHDYTPVTKTGYQKLNGLQATAYCRIRYKKGNDYARAASQREVIKAIEEQAKLASFSTLEKVFEKAMNNVITTLKTEDLLPYLTKINDFKIVSDDGFPQPDMRTNAKLGSKGDCIIPLDLESNVVWLHKYLFDDADYTVSETVKKYSRQIKADTENRLNK